jgi:hypothetical protein
MKVTSSKKYPKKTNNEPSTVKSNLQKLKVTKSNKK